MYLRFALHVLRLVIIAMTIVVIGWLIVVPLHITRLFANELPSKESIMRWNSRGIILTDRHGEPFFTLYRNRPEIFVSLSTISPVLRQAVISMEDHEFYTHRGFSLRAIGRSIVDNVEQGSLSFGGSTITQQLAKNTLLSPTKSFWRKYEELIIAWELENRYSKEEILEMYLNSVYFGQGAFGIEAASQAYFNKSSQNLSLAEASFLTGLLPSPSYFSRNSEQAQQRQHLVLQRLYEHSLISDEELKNALKQPLSFQSATEDINRIAPHFAIMVRQQLLSEFDEDTLARSGWYVKTTLDLNLQRYAEDTLARRVAELRSNQVSNGATVILNPRTGEILTLVGSIDWENTQFGKFNMATAPRQTGSAFKPLVYATAFEQRTITPATILHDIRQTFGKDYRPENYDGRFRGNIVVRRALALSLNIPAVEVGNRVGIPAVITLARRMGISTLSLETSNHLATALGSSEISLYELTSAYGTFANNGMWNAPVKILEINDKKHQPVAINTSTPQKAISEETAFLISSILSDTKARADMFGNSLTISKTAAVKTGTTNNYRDAWTMGYTPNIAVGVWVGNNDNKPMDRVAGSLGAAPIWRDLMEHVLTTIPTNDFTTPIGIRSVRYCGNQEFFIRGTEPRQQRCTPRPSITPLPSPEPPAMRPRVSLPRAD